MTTLTSKKPIPSKEEKRDYYHGLPSAPSLVARSDAAETEWEYRGDNLWYVPSKKLVPVGRHPIVDAINNTSLRDDVMEILDSRLPGWNCMDVVRIGLSFGPKPVILWIGVHPGSTTSELGLEVA